MKNRLLGVLAAAAGVLLAAGSALAHHGQAAYDTAHQITVKGTVTEFKFVNPHCIVRLDSKGEKGTVQNWQGELTSPNHLVRAGWNSQILKPGDEITITGYPAKSGATSLWITKVLLANGEELKAGAGN